MLSRAAAAFLQVAVTYNNNNWKLNIRERKCLVTLINSQVAGACEFVSVSAATEWGFFAR